MANNAVTYDGLVAKILGKRKVVLNKGSHDGISEGDEFLVFTLGEEIHDPKTGESLGILEEIKGKGKVVHAQDHLCTIQTYEFDLVPVPREQNPYLLSMQPFPYYGEREKRKVYREFVGVQRGDYARKVV